MVQPNSVYDPDADERPAHQSAPADDSSDPRSDYDPQTTPMGDSSDPRGELKNQEEGGLFNPSGDGKASARGALTAAEGAAASKLYNANPALNFAGKLKQAVRIRNKRRALIGAGAGSLIGGAILFAFMIASGPGQLIHLSKILQKPGFGTEKAVAKRTNGLFRYARSGGDVGETRVGYLGSKVFQKTITQLGDIGVEFQRNPRTGNPKSMTIDDDKLAKKYPELRSMSIEEKKAFLSNRFGVPPDKLVRVNGKFAVNTRDMGIKATRALTGNTLTLLEDGKTVSAIKFRTLSKFFNTPSLFHPFKKALANQENKAATKAERKAREKERIKAQQTGQPSSKFASARDKLRGKIQGNQGKFSAALLATAGMCIVRSVADEVPIVNRGAIAVPAALESVDKTAMGSQAQSGQDFSATQAGDTVTSFTDENGKSIWQGKALQWLADPNKPATGEDIDPGYQQAFAAATTANNLKDTLGGGGFGAVACSTPGQIVQVIGSLALVIGGPFTGGTSWGAFAARTSASMAATAGIIHLMQTQFTNLLTSDKIIPELMSGPQGGNLLAFGARESANISARASGGVALSSTETAVLEQEQIALEKKEFQSKNFLARIFDTKDYRSLSSSVARSVNPDVSQNITNVASSITNFGSLFSNVLSPLVPRAQAAESYNWGFPSYGIPQSILNDTRFEDPYDNASRIAELLNSDNGQGYVDRAKKCFGAGISKTNEGWGVVAQEDINPNEEAYTAAKCDDLSDDNWKRMLLFVFDTRTMEAVACYEGDGQACSNVGFGGSAATPSSSPTTSAADDVDLADLYKDSSNIDCAEGTKDVGVHTGYQNGQPFKLRLCALPDLPSSSEDSTPGHAYYIEGSEGKAMINARVSKNFANLVKDAKAAGIPMSAASSFRSMAHQTELAAANPDRNSVAAAGYSNHQAGAAIDFWMADRNRYPISRSACVNRDGVCEAPGDKVWEWLSKNASKYSLKQYVNEYWHFSPNGQ